MTTKEIAFYNLIEKINSECFINEQVYDSLPEGWDLLYEMYCQDNNTNIKQHDKLIKKFAEAGLLMVDIKFYLRKYVKTFKFE